MWVILDSDVHWLRLPLLLGWNRKLHFSRVCEEGLAAMYPEFLRKMLKGWRVS